MNFGKQRNKPNTLYPLILKKYCQKSLEQNLKNAEKDGVLKDKDKALKDIEISLNGLKEDLADWGLNDMTAGILTKILQLVFKK